MNPSARLLSGLSLILLGTGCVVTERVVVRDPGYRPAPAYQEYEPPQSEAVISVYIEPPIGQPAPIGCPWAPPPMLVEAPPPPPYEEAVWTGGYWVWQGTWVWAHGRWAAPPRPGYGWRPPYYENRDGVVVFITGHWGPRGVAFVPPPPGRRLVVEVPAPGAVRGLRPLGPPGVFVPPPPGSRMGLIVPAPVGTSPAVVTSAPPVVNVGMRITNNINNSRTTIVNNVTNVTIVAPPSATASGRAVNATMPAQAHLAAALPAQVRAPAPPPASARPMPSFVHGQPRVDLPPPQAVRPSAPPPAQPQPQPRPALLARPVAAPAPAPQRPVPPPPGADSRPAGSRQDRGTDDRVRRDEARRPEARPADRGTPPRSEKEDKGRRDPRAEGRPRPEDDKGSKRGRDPERGRD